MGIKSIDSKAKIGTFPNFFLLFLLFYVPQTHKKSLLSGMICRTGGIFTELP